MAEELLKSEGFTNVQYFKVDSTAEIPKALISGEADISLHFAAPLILDVDAGAPLTVLAGVHVGCFELFATDQIRAIRDLKGKTVGVTALGSSEHVFFSSMIAYVGLDPRKDINWAFHPPAESMQLLAEGNIDGFLALPPESQELRAQQIGHVLVNSALDRPWSGYFCCMATGNREFIRQHPVAAKRALRALLKAADLCATRPDQAAQLIADKGYTRSYDYTLQTLHEVPYDKWREYDPDDTLRFYSLRLHEAGMIQSTPDKIISQGTDWRFLNDLKRELKG